MVDVVKPKQHHRKLVRYTKKDQVYLMSQLKAWHQMTLSAGVKVKSHDLLSRYI